MRNTYKIFVLSALVSLGACKKDYLDINKDPNRILSATPVAVLPAAMTATAANVVNTYNSYGSWAVGYMAKSGQVNGYAPERTYNYTSNFYQGMWNNTYDNLNDYEFIIKQTAEDPNAKNLHAIANIMKAYNYQLLVDAYGDLPYTEALQGASVLTPKYDKAEDVYHDLVVQLDAAIKEIKDFNSTTATLKTADIVFKGNMTSWIKFANTLKLRVLLRMADVTTSSAFVASKFTTFSMADGFLTTNAVANPEYSITEGKQNPFWNRYNKTATGSSATEVGYQLPTKFVLGFYDGTKISDPDRKVITFRNATVKTVQLGEISPIDPDAASAWDISNLGVVAGIMKGADMGSPLMLASESNFLQAEAFAKGYLTGVALTAFNKGIENSFVYLYQDSKGIVLADETPVTYASSYITDNAGNKLVDFTAAITPAQQLEAIITQKYIALNVIHGQEAWAEFRRTGYPAIVNGSTNAKLAFASVDPGNISTRADKLPVRLLYPSSEVQLNSANLPAGTNQFTSRIFWDLN